MKQLADMTFEEASRARTALVAIAQILEEAGVVTLFDPNRPQKAKKKREEEEEEKPKPKLTRNRKKGGHKTKCGNPGCVRGPSKKPRIYISRRTNQRFCHLLCGQSYFSTIRSYARALARQNEDKVNEWLADNRWLTGAKADEDVARIIKLESRLWKRDQEKLAKKKKHQKGSTILKTTPTPAGH